MLIRKAERSDIDQIEEIYNEIHTKEEAGEITIGWERGVYPTRATAVDALQCGDLFVLEDSAGKVVAAARINQVQVPEYADAEWKDKEAADEQVMVLHTLVVDPETSGKGYGTAFVDYYEKHALKHNCPYLRMDTNERNTCARKLYKKLGYAEADIVSCVFNGIEGVQLVCLEKYIGEE